MQEALLLANKAKEKDEVPLENNEMPRPNLSWVSGKIPIGWCSAGEWVESPIHQGQSRFLMCTDLTETSGSVVTHHKP